MAVPIPYRSGHGSDRDVLKGRFELGERTISQSPSHSYFYAKEVLKDRFELGESIITYSPHFYYYIKYVVKGRLADWEPMLMGNKDMSDNYLQALMQ